MNIFYKRTNISQFKKLLDIKSFDKEYITKLCNNGFTNWNKYINFDSKQYSKKLIHSNDILDAYIISWCNNQESPIHNHPEKGCIMTILDGQIEESLYTTNLVHYKKNIYSKGGVSYIDNNIGYHKMKTIDTCVSLHIYSPPNYKMETFPDIIKH